MKILISVLIVLFGQSLVPLSAKQTSRPNFLFIIVDDQSPFDLKVYDPKSPLDSPNIDRLANNKFQVVKDATKRGETDETGSHWHGQQVMDYLAQRESAKAEKPFLIYFGFSHPHDERNGKPGLRDEVKVPGVWANRDEATIRNELGREFACSENIDIQIGRVLKKLEAMGELDNTYIIYPSDHGMAIGRHGLQGKQNLYEHTWRVPYIVKGPGIKPGMRSVKKGDWKLVKFDVLDGSVRETQLFNLKENPHEFLAEHGKNDPKLKDLADDPAHAEKLAEMEALLKREMKRLDDPYPLWDQK